MTVKTNLADCYRVFVVPGFWFDMGGVQFEGGPEHCGEDFLPFYNGTKETWDLFKPQVTLLIDGGAFSTQELIQRINFGTRKKPRWAYSRGLWFAHDSLSNGWHTVQLSALLTLNNSVGDWTWYVTMTNKPVRVCISNEVSFIGSIGYEGGLELVAQSVNPRVNWRLDLCDLRGAVVASKTGQTTNGDIRLTWNVRDAPQQARDTLDRDLHLGSKFTTWPLDAPPRGSSHHTKGPAQRTRDNWWDQRLGHKFVRKTPTPEDIRQHLLDTSDNPLEKEVACRPLRLLPPPDTSRRLPR
jgi:hypothetical protein